MDPYIEARDLWGDFQPSLICAICSALETTLPDNYVARISKRDYTVVADTPSKVEQLPQREWTIVFTPREQGSPVGHPKGDIEPISMRAFVAAEYDEAFIGIYALQPERSLVTRIEVLSPANKRPATTGWDLYRRQRQKCLLGATNLVEIDLLRGGQRMPMLDPWPDSPYALLVARSERAPYCRVWPAHFQRRVPAIPVPLAEPDGDLSLDLQPLIDTVYARSRYEQDIDYAKPLSPPLNAEETAWFAEQLRTRQPQA